jgi:hypothetical protein
MTDHASVPGTVTGATLGDVAVRADVGLLRIFVIAAGIGCALLFVAIGLAYQLQIYGDGSIFAYAVAVQDAWAFHWHNIPGRLFTYLFCSLPAEAYVALTGNAHGGIAVYGFLFFVAPLLGLGATWAADRSHGRIIFRYACLSTACLCPLVFGFPTEMWMAHSLFWPALALCHYAPRGVGGTAAVFAILLALMFTHAGALILAAAILATLALRGSRDATFLRASGAFVVILAIWLVVTEEFPPDAYIAVILHRAAMHVFDLSILTGDMVVLLVATLASYAVAFLVLRRFTPAKAHLLAAAIVALALVAYWRWFDHALHAENRYYLRTVLLLATLALGALAAAEALRAEGRLRLPLPWLQALTTALIAGVTSRAAAAAIALVLLVHAVETEKFVTAWVDYKAAVRTLAMGAASDPALGDPRFVSARRVIGRLDRLNLDRLSWPSTTPFLSVLVAPGFAPARLVVDPRANYFWLSCKTATESQDSAGVLPVASRQLVRVHACLHR